MNCEDCKYYDGRDRDDGIVLCDFGDTGIEECPYVDEGVITGETEPSGMKVSVDLNHLTEIIEESLKNSINATVETKVRGIIQESYGEIIKKKTEAAIDRTLDNQVEYFMQGNITIGGGWREPERTLTRTEYLTELVEAALSENFDNEKIATAIQSEVSDKISKFTNSVKFDINANVRSLFDDAMKTALTENVVKMLMDNETYRRLQGSMQNLLN